MDPYAQLKGIYAQRVTCNPWPDYPSQANISHHACLSQQAAQRVYCQSCRQGAKVRKLHPGLFQEIKANYRKATWATLGGNTFPEYQIAIRATIADSVNETHSRRGDKMTFWLGFFCGFVACFVAVSLFCFFESRRIERIRNRAHEDGY